MLGVVLLVMTTFDYRFLKVYAGFIYSGLFLLLVLVRIPGVGRASRHAQHWIAPAGLQISPRSSRSWR